jgi:hypothetical protein
LVKPQVLRQIRTSNVLFFILVDMLHQRMEDKRQTNCRKTRKYDGESAPLLGR